MSIPRFDACADLAVDGKPALCTTEQWRAHTGGKMVAQVGTISTNNDETLGTIIAEAMDKVGKDGVITVEEAKTIEPSLEIVEGMQFEL